MNSSKHVTTDSYEAEKSLSPSVVDKFGDISFQSLPSNLFNQNNNNSNIQSSQPLPHSNIFANNNKIEFQSMSPPNILHSENKQISPQRLQQTQMQINQENLNPNAIPNSKIPREPTPKPKPMIIADNASNKPSKPAKPTWKQEFNRLVREAKALQTEKKYLPALKSYISASKVAPKEFPKLKNKIEKIQDLCYDKKLEANEEAFERIGDSPWHKNIVTDNYHLEANKQEDIDEDELYDEEEQEYIIPAEIFDKLYDYQRESLVWLWKLYQSPCGGILGDDMGLGKTVQICAFLHGAYLSGLATRCLLVLPVSVMSHWIKELNVWCKIAGYKVKKYHSSITKKRRAENLASIAKRGGILITSYGMVQKNYASMDIQSLTQKVRNNKVIREGKKWDYMILDEGHKIKNHLIGTAKAVRQIPVNNSNKIILSGTFLQNELSELWSLFDFISEGHLFGSYRAFNKEFKVHINAGRLKHASLFQKQLSNRLLNLIKKTVKPYLLRRTKQEIRKKQESASSQRHRRKKVVPILDCEKRELVVWIRMTSVQTDIYRTFLESTVVKETLNTTKSPLAALTVLKKICDHPFLLSDKMANCQELTQLAAVTEDKGIANTLATSNKMSVLLQLVQELIDKKHRLLVFSQYKIILSMIEPIFKANKIRYMRMDGSTPIGERQGHVDVFNKMDRFQVFLLSTRVGGLGLNLVGADRVIIYDPAWNPATDAQAVDRSYRIGQVNDVMVYRFVTCGTIEEKIYRRQISKVGLLKSVTGQSNQHRYFSKAELKEVFKLENPEMSQTQIQFKALGQHRVGTNAEFDRETDFVEHVSSVYGISHHDLLFRTCPKEELEDNAELAEQIEAVRKRVINQTPRVKLRNNRNEKKKEKINDLLEGRLDLSDFMPVSNRKNKNIKPKAQKEVDDAPWPFRYNFDENVNHNLNKSNNSNSISNPNSMDVDSEENINVNNASFISNISSIPKENSNSWSENINNQVNNNNVTMSTTETGKKRRTLKKKQNRFIADSDSESEHANDDKNQFPHRKRNSFSNFNFMPSTHTNNKNKNDNNNSRISNYTILQTPIFNQTINKKNNDKEEDMEAINMKDIVSVIRTQPRRKRKKSFANLQQLLDAQESEESDKADNDNNDNMESKNDEEYDSEATQSEVEEVYHVNTASNPQSNSNINNISYHSNVESKSNSFTNGTSSPQPPSNNSFHNFTNNNISFHNDSPKLNSTATNNAVPSRNNIGNISSHSHQQSPSNNPFFGTSNTNTNNVSMHMSFHTNNSNNSSHHHSPNINMNRNLSNNMSFQSDEHNKNNINCNNNNPYIDNNLLNQLQTFSPKQNKSFEELHNLKANNQSQSNNNNSWDFNQSEPQPIADGPDYEYDDEETLSDEEMFDLSPSQQRKPLPATEAVTAQEIFETDNIEKTEHNIICKTPLKHVSPQKIKNLSTNFKRYRRKSFIPQFDDYDDEETQDEQHENKEENKESVRTVCDKHRMQSQQTEGFEYECLKCACFLTEYEKNEYKLCLEMAANAEIKQDWSAALEHTMNALDICNQEVAVHVKCVFIADHLCL